MSKTVSRWMVVSAAVQGLSHEGKGVPCQDAVHHVQRDGVTVVALADGAGSARYAEPGAESVVHSICDLLGRSFDTFSAMESSTVAVALVRHLHERLYPVAREFSTNIRELASTLAFVAVKRGRYLAGNLGDGVLGCERNGQLEVLCHPQRGEFINQTYFVTGQNAAEQLEIKKGGSEGITAFFLMSDGTAEAFYHRRSGVLGRGLSQVSSWVEDYPAKQLARQLQVNLRDQVREQTDDDCSLAVLRHLSFPLNVLRAKSTLYQRDFLGSGSMRGAANRIQVLQNLLDEQSEGSAAAPEPGRSLSKRAFQRHAGALSNLLEFESG